MEFEWTVVTAATWCVFSYSRNIRFPPPRRGTGTCT
jgi:hypothetical protein